MIVPQTWKKKKQKNYVYLCIVHHSVNKCPPRSNSLDSFDFAMSHRFRKRHHVQNNWDNFLQWATTSMCTLLIHNFGVNRNIWILSSLRLSNHTHWLAGASMQMYSKLGLYGPRGYSGHNTKRITNGRCPAQIAPRTQSHLTHSFCKTQHPNG